MFSAMSAKLSITENHRNRCHDTAVKEQDLQWKLDPYKFGLSFNMLSAILNVSFYQKILFQRKRHNIHEKLNFIWCHFTWLFHQFSAITDLHPCHCISRTLFLAISSSFSTIEFINIWWEVKSFLRNSLGQREREGGLFIKLEMTSLSWETNQSDWKRSAFL